jgi:peptidoglycan/LPS O-acetylase OafA/YrhL
MNNNKNWVNGMDSLRFILALIVLLSHLENPYVAALKASNNVVGKVLAAFLANAFSGIAAVIAFFIISGFVVHYPVKDKPLNVRKFLIRRWIRVGIPLIIIVVATAYFDKFVLIPIWSLYCELMYYTIYPILRRIKLSWTIKLRIAYLIQVLIILILCQNDIKSLIFQKDFNYYATYWQTGSLLTWLIGLPVWLLGVVIAEKIGPLSIKLKNITYRELTFYRLAIFAASVILHALKFHFFLSDIIALNIFALLIVKWIEREIIYYQTHKSLFILEYSGKFSYSLYLCHGLCVYFLASFMDITIYNYPIFIALSLIIAYITYLLIENPAHKLAQKLALINAKKSLITEG